MNPDSHSMKRNFSNGGFPPGQMDAQRPKRDFSSGERQARFKTKTCKFFPQGSCSKGEACPYIHDTSANAGGAAAVPVQFAANPYPPVDPNFVHPAYFAAGQAPPAMAYDPYGGYRPVAGAPGPVAAPFAQFAPSGEGGAPYDPYLSGAADPVLVPYPPQAMPMPFGFAPNGFAAPPMAPEAKRLHPGRFKTHPCKFFPEGKCSRGQACTYLHGDDDPNKDNKPPAVIPPMQRVAPVQFGGAQSPRVIRYKIKPCKFFSRGQCTKGDACSYKHEVDGQDSEMDANGNAGPEGVEGRPPLTPNAEVVHQANRS